MKIYTTFYIYLQLVPRKIVQEELEVDVADGHDDLKAAEEQEEVK